MGDGIDQRYFLFGAVIEQFFVVRDLLYGEGGERSRQAHALFLRDGRQRVLHLRRRGEYDPLRLLRPKHVLLRLLAVQQSALSSAVLIVTTAGTIRFGAMAYLRSLANA